MTKLTRHGTLASAFVALCVAFAAIGCGGSDASSHVVTAKLVSIDVAPATPSIAVGATQQFTATGKYDDSTTKDLTAMAAWSSGTTATATISTAGLATGVAVGTTTITASSGGKSGTATLAVKQATLVAVVVSPAAPSIAVGGTQQFTAEGRYDDGSKADVTSTATWSSGTTATATISTAGLATGVAAGTTAITATSGGVSGSAALTVTGTTALTSITVTSATNPIASGTTTQLTATATYADGSKKDISATATWTSATATVATVSASGLAKGVGGGTSVITAASSGVTGTLTLTVTAAKLVSIAVAPVAPGTLSIAAGTSQAFTATGTFDDNTTQDLTATATWASATAATASISTAGVAKGLATGTTEISASVTANGAAIKGTATLTVTAALLTSIAVTANPTSVAAGTTSKFTAIGTFGDNSTQDLTTQVTWTSGTPTTATISGTAPTIGVATALVKGTTVITAKLGTVTGTATLTVTDIQLVSISVTTSPTSPAKIAKKTNIQLVATGVFTDGSKQDLTTTAVWDTSKATVATVLTGSASAGLVSGVAAGAADISATVTIGTGANAPKISGKLSISVTDAQLVSLAVTLQPATATGTIPAGITQQFIATGIFTDATTQDLTATVTWKSDKTAFATVSNAAGSRGLAKGVAPGAAQISATIGAITDARTLTVTTATLQSIAITPPTPTLALGTKISLVATGTYSDTTTVDLTKIVNWTSATGSVATISNADGTNGQVSTLAKGMTVIKATTTGGVSAMVTLTVADIQLASLQVTATKLTIEKGTTVQFTATGIYTDQSKQDVTKMATWKTDKADVATISNSTASTGLATAMGTGKAIVTATIGTISDTETLTVDDGKLVSIAVTPATPTIAAGTKLQFVATGTFDDGAKQDITSLVTWASDNAAATISNADDKALATGATAGSANISAKDPTTGVSGTTKLTVTATKLKTIVVTTIPDGMTSIAKGTTVQYIATGFFEDASHQDLTDSVLWNSSVPATASISNAPASNGLATGLVVGGPINVTATLGTVVSAAVPLTVSPKVLTSIAVTPATPSVPKGGTVQLIATGTYSDGTTQILTADAALTWTSAAATTAKVSNAAGQHGVVTGVALGMTDITATSKGVTGKVTVTVTAPVVATIAVTPAAPTVALGHTQQFVAKATLTDGTQQDISATATWASSVQATATISTAGLATTVAKGTTQITATSNGVVSNKVTLTVN